MSQTYLRTEWIHDFQVEPSLFYHELDHERYATRKVEVFKDGRMIRASAKVLERDPTALPDQPVPPLEELNTEDNVRVWQVTA
ncbi:MAG TPA: hypothetical protein VFY59_04605, partial [Rubrobacter sp.]|nr:hypothetical protein [Rubrobacter sp.]